MRPGLPLLILLALVPTARASNVIKHRAAGRPSWQSPSCVNVSGSPAVTFTRNEGKTLTAMDVPLHGVGYTYGLAALDLPNTLLSFFNTALSISTDAGCSWRTLGTFDAGFPPFLTAAPGGRAYAWSPGRDFLLTHDLTGDTQSTLPFNAVGLGADPKNGARFRVAADDGTIGTFTIGQRDFVKNGVLRPITSFPAFYRAAFDPTNFDHIVFGTAQTGAFVSRDGGTTWTQSTGITKGKANVFNAVISPADPNVVWIMALDITENDTLPDSPAHGKHIYRSTDGGNSFTSVIDAGPNVTLINGPTMAAHPTNPNILYFTFGTFTNGYGTDLFRYDSSTKQLTVQHNSYHGIDSIAFNPSDPTIMYLGLQVVEGAQ